MFIIFGTRGITTTPERGDFHCPGCNSTTEYHFKRVRRFFTLFFIPLIPLDKLGEYVECRTCSGTYKTESLAYNPETEQAEIEAEYHSGVKKVMIHMLLADGEIDGNEVASLCEIYQKISGSELSEPQARIEIASVQKSRENLMDYVQTLQGLLNDSGKETVLRAAMLIALADGEFHDNEKNLIAEIGQNLGMTKAHFNGVISEF